MKLSKPACRVVSLAVGAAYVLALGLPARADTLPGALAQAYSCNPVLNAQRAALGHRRRRWHRTLRLSANHQGLDPGWLGRSIPNPSVATGGNPR